MFHTHWSDQFPYLVPIWHSLSNQNLQNVAENSIDLNLTLDFGGTGFYNQTALRHYQPLQFSTNRLPLPFYIKPRPSKNVSQASRNCLAFSNNHKVLFSANQAKINSISVSIYSARFQHNSNDVDFNCKHQFTDKKTSTNNPFCFHAENIFDLTEPPKNNAPSDHILEIRLEERDNQDLKVWCQTRTSLKGYKFYSQHDENKDLNSFVLELDHDINATSKALFPSESSLLNFWDRNDVVTEYFLASFIENNNIYMWNIEANKYLIENTVDSSSRLANSSNLIGLQWAKDLNPFLYYYGTHNDIFLGDTRLNMNGSQRTSQTIMNANNFPHFKNPIELFQTFTTNPGENHQIITSSDFSINFLDIRFPGKNIFQCKHMMTSRLVNKLYSKQLVGRNGCEMLLLASNSERSCLFAFNGQNSIQPVMQSYPYYIGMPKETGSLFPALKSDKSFTTGMQILLGKHSTEGDSEDFISIAQLTNHGDIYMQDLWPLNQEPSKQFCITSSDENQKATSQKDLSEDLDTASKLYLKSVIKYLKSKSIISCRTRLSNRLDQTKNRQRKKKLNVPNTEDGETFQHIDSSLQSQSDLENGQVNSSVDTILEEGSDDEQISFGECNISDELINRSGKKVVDIDLFQRNWHSFTSIQSSSVGLRDICHPLTVSICEEWFAKLNTTSSPIKSDTSPLPE